MKKIFLTAPVIKVTVVLFAFVLLVPLSARSEIREGSYEISPFIGYNLFDSQHNLDDDYLVGARFGYNFTKNFGMEIAGEYIQTGIDDISKPWTQEGEFTNPINDVDIILYNLNFLRHFMPEKKFNPFIAAGYGFAKYDPKINDHDMAFVSFGLGAKYWLSDNFAMRLDLKDSMILDETLHNFGATLGFVFAFGGKTEPARAGVSAYEPIPSGPEPEVREPIVILAADPKFEEKVVIVASEPKLEKREIVLAFEDVHFDFDKSNLTKEAQAILKRSIMLIKDNPKAKIRIAGYTSASGTKEYNQKLSERRAKAVYDYLINEGLLPPDKLSTIGYGEKTPAIYEPIPKDIYSPEAKANMRVLFEVIAK